MLSVLFYPSVSPTVDGSEILHHLLYPMKAYRVSRIEGQNDAGTVDVSKNSGTPHFTPPSHDHFYVGKPMGLLGTTHHFRKPSNWLMFKFRFLFFGSLTPWLKNLLM